MDCVALSECFEADIAFLACEKLQGSYAVFVTFGRWERGNDG